MPLRWIKASSSRKRTSRKKTKAPANIGKRFAKSCAQFMTACSPVPAIAAIVSREDGTLAVQKTLPELQLASEFTLDSKHMKKSDFIHTLAFLCVGLFGLLLAIVSALAS